MSNPDEIRAKRLARLGGNGSRSPASSSASVNSSDGKQKPASPAPVAASPSVATNPPSAAPTAQPPSSNQTQPPVRSEAHQAPPEAHQAQPAATKPAPAKPRPSLSLSEWFVSEIPELFGASVDPTSGLLPLESVAADDAPETHLDEIFMEILTAVGVPTASPLEYLFAVHQRAFRLKRRMPVASTAHHDAKVAVLNQVGRLACNYALIALQEPDMFVKGNANAEVAWLINHPQEGSFVADIVAQADEQDSVVDLLNVVVPRAQARLAETTVADPGYSRVLSLFETLIGLKPVARSFYMVDGFFPDQDDDPLAYEHHTVLGQLLRLSPLTPKATESYFSGVPDLQHPTQSALNGAYASVCADAKVLTERLYKVVDCLVRGGGDTRGAVLQWMAQVVNLSHLRRGSHADFAKLPSDGIMTNVSMILIKLAGPFLDYPVYSKLDKIHADYLDSGESLVDVAEESRVNASLDDARGWSPMDRDANFISHCFYLSLAYLHYGLGGVYNHYARNKSALKQYRQRIADINDGSVAGANPMMLTMMRNTVPRLQGLVREMECFQHAVTALFSSADFTTEVFDFVVGCCTYLLRVIDPQHAYPQQAMAIPFFRYQEVSQLDDAEFLRSKAPEPWRFMPEFVLEGIINFCKFSTEFVGCPLVNNSEHKLAVFIEFTIVLLRCPELLGNPHMKSNLVELLFIGALPMRNGSPGFFANVYATNPMVRDNLLFCLLDFYVSVEKTGASNQFYDKFNSRYHVSVILEEIWKGSALYKQQLAEYSRTSVDFFVRFVARMLNDTTYLLDESFKELAQIHTLQVETRKRAQGQPADDELGTDDEVAQNLEQAERTARSYSGLANKTIELFKLFTREVPQAFTLTEVVDRLAAMVDYNLAALVGPKCSNLKVEQPEKYQFDPKRTLADLCTIYVNLAGQKEFMVAVSRDQRSFSLAHFQKAEQVLLNKTYTDAKLVAKFAAFAQAAEAQRVSDERDESELGEIPDEFLDPLMFTLMTDPVVLPTSRISIDRSTIKAHLLSDPTDPFNRSPLKLEDVVADDELKAKIEAFKQSKRAARE
ncbi:E4 ubiquitin-protein ligase Ufd2p [Diutina catenulata]